MKRFERVAPVALVAVFAAASPASAGVTVNSSVTGKGRNAVDKWFFTMTVTSVERAPLAADLFAVPAGYRLKEQQ